MDELGTTTMTAHHPGLTRAAKALLVGAALAVTVSLVSCGSDSNSIAAQARAGDDKGYIAGDGTIEQIVADRRGSTLQITGTTLAGKPWTLAKESGNVVVLNMWGSWCGPCVAEAPELQKAWRQFSVAKQPVQFMGLDFKEGPAAGRAFERKYGITYPSLAYDGGATQLALRGQAPTVPTTLVVDRQGRIAARILGQTTAPTLTRLVKTVLAER